MGNIYLVYGGAGSGKSEYAEKLCEKIVAEKYFRDNVNCEEKIDCNFSNMMGTACKKIYLATMKNDGSTEASERIKRHRRLREGKGFITIEKEKNISEIDIEKNSLVLLEDLSNLLSNVMFSKSDFNKEKDFSKVVMDGIIAFSKKVDDLVIVCNDVFHDGICYDESTELFIKNLGKLHLELAKKAISITRVIYGIPVSLKE